MPGYFLLGLALSLATTLPLAWKWVLGVRRTAVVVAALSLSTGMLMELTAPFFAHDVGILARAGGNWLLTLTAASALLAYRFYRDPERDVLREKRRRQRPASSRMREVRALVDRARFRVHPVDRVGPGGNFDERLETAQPGIEGKRAALEPCRCRQRTAAATRCRSSHGHRSRRTKRW